MWYHTGTPWKFLHQVWIASSSRNRITRALKGGSPGFRPESRSNIKKFSKEAKQEQRVLWYEAENAAIEKMKASGTEIITDIVVEVLSKGNTPREMQLKLRECLSRSPAKLHD